MMTKTAKKASILLVDDDPTNLRFLQEVLKDSYKIYAAPSGEKALKFLEKIKPNLILLDIEMPNMNGYEVIKTIKSRDSVKNIPIIFLTAQEGREKEQEAFDLGAVDYILKPITAGIVRSRVGLHVELESYKKNLEEKIEMRTEQLKRTQDAILDMLASVTSFRDNETGAHIKRTTYYISVLVNNLIVLEHPDYKMTYDYAKNIIKTAKLHDIGKVAVPDNILLKPGKLTEEEFDLIKQHTNFGAQIIDVAMRDINDDNQSEHQSINDVNESAQFLYIAKEIILSHHEKWNGAGYPFGLKGTDIPLSGRLMAIADVYDALISRRVYKEAFDNDYALEVIFRDSGTHFDPTLVELSKNVLYHFKDIAERFKDKESD